MTHTVHVIVTSSARISKRNNLYASVKGVLESTASDASDIAIWQAHVTEVCDTNVSIPYVDALLINEDNGKFDRYKVVPAETGGGTDALIAFYVGARTDAEGKRLGPDDMILIMAPQGDVLRKLCLLHNEAKGPRVMCVSDDERKPST
jgi:hypothetical protein